MICVQNQQQVQCINDYRVGQIVEWYLFILNPDDGAVPGMKVK